VEVDIFSLKLIKMRILQICPKPPNPRIDGGCIAMDAINKGLKSEGNRVRTIAMSTSKHPNIEGANEGDYSHVEIDTILNPISALLSLLANKSYNIARFRSRNVEAEISKALKSESFDAIILESLYSCSYIDLVRSISKAKVYLRAHNIEHKIWSELSENTSNPIKKWYLQKLSTQLKNFEIEVIGKVDGIITITKNDSIWFKSMCKTPTTIVPFGINVTGEFVKKPYNRVFHFGSMDWKPNIEGVNWLVKEVWPKVREENNEAQLILAGRNMPSHIISNFELGIEVVGEVSSSDEFLNSGGIATVPILSGSGMRVKAIEAMSKGLPVVGTSLGLTGIGAVNNENSIIADSPNDFAIAIIQLLNSEEKANEIAQSGFHHIEKNFSNKIIFSELNNFLNH
tara:strand:- start:3118 stop:4314 length:1197 start_codon:yes stop_codon:yes gene_type:complete